MVKPVTECAYINLKPGVDLEEDTAEAQIWKETIATLSAQHGYQRCYYGRQCQIIFRIKISTNVKATNHVDV